jgi:hypothetical protein
VARQWVQYTPAVFVKRSNQPSACTKVWNQLPVSITVNISNDTFSVTSRSSPAKRCVVEWVVTDVSMGHIASIFTLKQSNNTLLVQLDPTDEGTTFPGQADNHLPNDTAFHHRSET